MLKDFINKAKKLCSGCIEDDEVCIFVIALVIGFLLCVFLKNNEPFDNWYSDLEEVEKDIMKGSPSVKDPPPQLGLQPKKRMNENIPPSLKKDYGSIQAAKQYQAQNIQNTQGLMKMENSQFKPFQGWDYHGYAPVDVMFNLEASPKDMGKGPMGPDKPMMPSAPSAPSGPSATGSELVIVLIYADWCGHSKKMLPDFAKIESEFHNQTINGTLVKIEKYTDKEKDKVKEFGVRGFPTLFSIKDGNRSPLNERTYDGLKNHIMSNA